jgi:flagellar motor switch protein FliG
MQADIVQRIAELASVPEEVLVDLGSAVAGQVERLGMVAQPGVPTGGAKLAAEIINQVGEETEYQLLSSLDERAPALADTIRSLMLTFDDLRHLENRSVQTLLREVGRDDLLLALKTATQAMQERIFSNMSVRAREIMLEDLSTMGPVRLKDVERAQATIVLTARRLAEEQKIQLGLAGGDALV